MRYDVQRMVVEVNKLITNELLTEEGIYLPGIGSLSVELEGSAAHRAVVFSEAERHTSLVAVIAMRTGCSADQAAKLYEQWSEAVHKSLQVEIDGIGVVRGGRFEMSSTLDKRLNPVVIVEPKQKVEVEEPKGRSNRLWVSVVVICLVVVGACFAQWIISGDEPESVPMVALEPSTPVGKPVVDTVVDADTAVVEAVVEPIEEPQEIVVVDEEQAPKLLTVRQAKLMPNSEAVEVFDGVLKQSEARAETKYKVVYGVYTSKANAGRAIVNARSMSVDDKTIFGASLREGKYVVTLFESDYFYTSVSYMKRNRERMGDTLWVYDPDKM